MLQTSATKNVCTLVMAHGKVNAMDIEFCRSLIDELNRYEQSNSTCMLLRSNTPKGVFSAGIDLKRIVNEPCDYTREYLPELIQLFERVYFCRKPIIALVEGVAIAGGCILAAGCTERIATQAALFGMPAKKLEVSIPQIAPEILRSAAPRDVADRLHGGVLYSAQEALDCGLVSKVLPNEQVEAAVTELAAALTESDFLPRTRDNFKLSQYESADQAMVEEWCSEPLRQRLRDYLKSL